MNLPLAAAVMDCRQLLEAFGAEGCQGTAAGGAVDDDAGVDSAEGQRRGERVHLLGTAAVQHAPLYGAYRHRSQHQLLLTQAV